MIPWHQHIQMIRENAREIMELTSAMQPQVAQQQQPHLTTDFPADMNHFSTVMLNTTNSAA
eukprot:8849-Eustigmatos_ZCMA.PRE.1